MRKLICASFLVLAGCVSTTTTQSPSPQPSQPQAQSAQSKATTPTAAQVSRFKTVVSRVEPVAERMCREPDLEP